MKFTYPERLGVEALAETMGCEFGKIVETAKNKYRIDFGDGKFSHDEGVPAIQLKQWIAGAVSVLGFAKKQFDEAKNIRDETVAGLVPDGDDLVKALVKECEANAVDQVEMATTLWPYIDGEALTARDVKDLAENVDSDLIVWTDEELQDYVSDQTADIIQYDPIYKLAVRVAYGGDKYDVEQLRHTLSSEHNVHHPYLI